jgi:hypothetical protein
LTSLSGPGRQVGGASSSKQGGAIGACHTTYLPELGANLVAALAGLQARGAPHRRIDEGPTAACGRATAPALHSRGGRVSNCSGKGTG